MLASAQTFEHAEMITGPEPELSGPDDMYVPTTQIKIVPGGSWHRRSAIATETACGQTYGASGVREYQLAGELCRQCFTFRELWLAAHPEEITP